MITTKERASLKRQAQVLSANVMIGKDGLTQEVKDQIEIALDNRELIKIKALKTADLDVRELLNELAREFRAEPVVALGGVMVLYRFSKKKGITHISLKD